MFYVYVLENEVGELYFGSTNDLNVDYRSIKTVTYRLPNHTNGALSTTRHTSLNQMLGGVNHESKIMELPSAN